MGRDVLWIEVWQHAWASAFATNYPRFAVDHGGRWSGWADVELTVGSRGGNEVCVRVNPVSIPHPAEQVTSC